MTIKNTDNTALDRQIAMIQDYIEKRVWDIRFNSSQHKIYGLLTEAQGIKGMELTWAQSSEHPLIFHDDRVISTIGFRKLSVNLTGSSIATVDVIATIDLKRLYGTAQRSNERALSDLWMRLQSCPFVVQVTGRKAGNKEVFNGIDITNYKGRDKFPRAAMAVTCEIEYQQEPIGYDN